MIRVSTRDFAYELPVRLPSKWTIAVVLVLLAVVGYLTAPLFWPFWFAFYVAWPAMVFIVVTLVAAFRWRMAAVPLALITAGYLATSHAAADAALARETATVALAAIPETDVRGLRILPKEVAYAFARNKIRDPQTRIGDVEPLFADVASDGSAEFLWTGPKIPNGIINALTGQSTGFVRVHQDGAVEETHEAWRYAEGLFLWKGLYWQTHRTNFFVEKDVTYYFADPAGGMLGVTPYIGYSARISALLPVMVPHWGGVIVTHADGRQEDLTPEQAMGDARLVGQPLYPERLAVMIGDAWQYRGGILNAWFVHADQTELPRLEGVANQMPYLLRLRLPDRATFQPVWFVGLEPYGPSFSIHKMLFTNAQTGQLFVYELPPERGLIGPRRAMDYVRTGFPLPSLITMEPRPLTSRDRAYWMFSLTTTQFAGIARTVFVDAESGALRSVETNAEVRDFVLGRAAGRAVDQVTALAGAAGASSTGAPAAAPTDITRLSDADLTALLRQIADEIERRRK